METLANDPLPKLPNVNQKGSDVQKTKVKHLWKSDVLLWDLKFALQYYFVKN